jgi:CPA1 family monovalent cation:H+ antiporter
LNAVLFVLIGLEVLVLTFNAQYLLAGLLAIPLVLVARAVSVGIPDRDDAPLPQLPRRPWSPS